jgi:hypothetical protein
LTKSVFLHRLYSGIFSSGHTGFIQDITQVLRKYKLQNYLRTYTHGGEFPPKKHWKAIIKDSVIEYEKNMCNRILSDKGDVQRFLRIMDRRLYIKSYPLYTASMHSVEHLKLLKLAKLVCLPTGTIRQCELCNNDYNDITEHIIMSCSSLHNERNCMWDDMVNNLGVEKFVNLWSRPDEEILDILLGGRWPPLHDPNTRQQFYDILCRYTDAYYKAVQSNLKWLR